MGNDHSLNESKYFKCPNIVITANCKERYVYRHVAQWPLLLTWSNYNPSMDKLSHAQ